MDLSSELAKRANKRFMQLPANVKLALATVDECEDSPFKGNTFKWIHPGDTIEFDSGWKDALIHLETHYDTEGYGTDPNINLLKNDFKQSFNNNPAPTKWKAGFLACLDCAILMANTWEFDSIQSWMESNRLYCDMKEAANKA